MNNAQLALLESAQQELTLSDSAVVGRYAALSPEKLRGGYYTPDHVAAWISAWAIRSSKDSVLEPSCGDGAFLEAVLNRLELIGDRPRNLVAQVVGIEISAEEASLSRARVNKLLGRRSSMARVLAQDFFSWWLSSNRTSSDVVVGNPPFIRYQTFPEPSRERAMRVMRDLGLTPNRLTNIWVPFVVASVACLKPGGRLGMVVPAELLQVSYASQLRAFLTDRFERIDIVACNDLFFENAEQEVVLLLAQGLIKSPSDKNLCRVAMAELSSAKELRATEPSKLLGKSQCKDIRHDSEKWLKYFLSSTEIGLMRRLREDPRVTELSSHGEVDVGVVTGKNEFFLLSHDQVKKLGAEKYVTPIVGRSAHIRGVRFTEKDWNALAEKGDRVYLLNIPAVNGHELPYGCLNYIREGELAGFQKGYKCSIRDPWYAVPSVWVPDGFIFRQIYDFPRAVLNRASATSTDTIHRLRCRAKPELVAKTLYTSLTAASAEIEGRSYGGGVLELEPTEAERLLMPARLNGGMPLDECDRLLRSDRLTDLIEENDKLVLRDGLGIDRNDCKMLNNIWTKMRDRRSSRRRSTKPRS